MNIAEVGDHLLVNFEHNIKKFKPTLNSQKDIKIPHLFRYGIT